MELHETLIMALSLSRNTKNLEKIMFPVISCQLKKEPMANWNGPIHMLAPGCKAFARTLLATAPGVACTAAPSRAGATNCHLTSCNWWNLRKKPLPSKNILQKAWIKSAFPPVAMQAIEHQPWNSWHIRGTSDVFSHPSAKKNPMSRA